MKILMDLINTCFSQTSCLKFHVIQESNWEWVNIQICYDSSQKQLKASSNWKRNDLAHLYWEAGLITSESEQPLEDWIRKEGLSQRVRGIAPDTNLLIPGFVSSFLRKIPQGAHEIVPVLVLFARSIQYELHTMRAFTYSRKRFPTKAEECFKAALNTWEPMKELWNIRNPNQLTDRISQLSNARGRLGIKGTYEVDTLQQWAPVIIIKPPHVLHSPKVLEDTPFLNAVHDSLIRYEIDFLHQNTSLPILFITNDKDQCKAAQQEGMKALYIEKPHYSRDIELIASQNLNSERIKVLILSLLTYSPVVRITFKENTYFLSWTWCGRQMNDLADHKIRVVDSSNNVMILTP